MVISVDYSAGKSHPSGGQPFFTPFSNADYSFEKLPPYSLTETGLGSQATDW